MQVRTAFNILGPMLNPAGAKYALVGVYDPAISPLMAAALQRLGLAKALVVHSQGLDELTPMGDADIVEVGRLIRRKFSQMPQISMNYLTYSLIAAHIVSASAAIKCGSSPVVQWM